MRVLLVEDDHRIANFVAKGLREQAYAVDVVHNGEDALYQSAINTYDLVVLDVMIPAPDGFAVCKELRKTGHRMPILMLTARDAVEDRIQGLDRGADDYLLKPFAMKELAARLRALLRRPGGPLGVTINIGNICLDTTARHLKVDGRAVSIPPRELDALELLMRRTDKIVSKRAFEDSIYGFNEEVTANTIEALVSRLRRRLHAVHASVTIHTLRGIGYLITE